MLDKFCLHCNHKLSLFINFSHHQQRALKDILLFLAHSFAFDIKASLVTNILYFIKLRNTPKQRHQCQDFSLSFIQKKTLFVRHENNFVYTLCQWRTHTALTVYSLPAARLLFFSAHRPTFLFNAASYVKHFSMEKNWQKTEHTWMIRMSGNDWTQSWGLTHSLRWEAWCGLMNHSECVHVRFFSGYPVDSLKTCE
jgi:hypothetical protein